MKITIKEIAKQAGVSIATVSHVINKTRYVSPELEKKVEEIMEKNGYDRKKPGKLKVGKLSTVAFVVPNIDGTVYARLIASLLSSLKENGYLLSVYFSNDSKEEERHILNSLTADKTIAGIILAPVSSNAEDYTKLRAMNFPILCLERTMKGGEVPCVLSDNSDGIYKAVNYLIKSGHESIAFLMEEKDLTTAEDRLKGYRHALSDAGLSYREDLVIRMNLYEKKECEKMIQEAYLRQRPTAFLAGGNSLTLHLLKVLQNMGLECPKDVSIIGFGDEEWCELVTPPITTLKQDTETMGKLAGKAMAALIEGEKPKQRKIHVPISLAVRKSIEIVGRGPFGETPVSPDKLMLSEEEMERLRKGGYKVAISFHFSGNEWKRLHENGIRETLEKCGISVLAVTDAQFDPLLQVTQLEGLRMQKPDAIIAIPADDEVTAQKFRELAKDTKLIFMSTVPAGMKKEEYSACVSVNERENGHNVGMLLGNYFKGKRNIKVGFINHGAPFLGTHLRDGVAEQTIREDYDNIEIVEELNFYQIENAYSVCKRMLTEHPDIQGLYVSWDLPALEALRALKEMEREDIAVFTFDLDFEIAKMLAEEDQVMGLSTQRPYEQGVAVALATAKALLGEQEYKYVGVAPYVVEKKNLLRAWKEIVHEPAPKELQEILENNLRK